MLSSHALACSVRLAEAWRQQRQAARLPRAVQETKKPFGEDHMRSAVAGAFIIALVSHSATPALAADPLKIGVLMETSGVFAVLGERQLKGMRFAVEEAGGEVAGRKIELLHEDTEGE